MIRRSRIAALGTALALAFAFSGAQAAPRAPQVHTPGATALLIQDVAPYGTAFNEAIMTSLGVLYDTVGTEELPRINLSQYSTVVIASDQDPTFYSAINAHEPAIERWLRNGARTLEYHASRAALKFPSSRLPGGVIATANPQLENALTGVDSPLVAGLPAEMHGAYANHTVFTSTRDPGMSVLIVTDDATAAPVMIDYCFGPGRVIASGQTVELAVQYGWNFAPVLANMLTASTLMPGCPY